MARRRTTNVRDRLPEFDRTKVFTALAGVILLMVLVLPRVYPAARQGPSCSALANPIGGNNRSVLAQAGNDQQLMDLNIHLENDTVNLNQPLRVRVTFVNQDIGPIILYLSPQGPLIMPNANGIGLFLEISQIGTGAVLSEQVAPPQPPASFDYNDLHLLGSRARCSETFDINVNRLQNIGLQPGEYRIRAYYRNTNQGQMPLPQPGMPAPTATPMYQFQGVWTGEISSEDRIFRVQ